MITRRGFLASSSGLALSGLAAANAGERCAFVPAMGQQACEVGVDLDRFDEVYAAQRDSQWCWAASASMLFAYYGHPVEQGRIVETVYGRVVNLPAFSTRTISALLSRQWEDDDGEMFEVQMHGAYDPFMGFNSLSNAVLVSELSQEHPFIYCNRSHCMVLTALAYVRTPAGPQPYNAGFFDPWPGHGARGAAERAELVPVHAGGALTYLALARIRELE